MINNDYAEKTLKERQKKKTKNSYLKHMFFFINQLQSHIERENESLCVTFEMVEICLQALHIEILHSRLDFFLPIFD